MSRIHSVPRPLTLPVRLNEPLGKAYQLSGSLSTSPLRFQQGFLKIPEGVCQPAIDRPTLLRASLSHSYVLNDQEWTKSSHPVFPVFSELTDQETRILQIARVRKQQGMHWPTKTGTALGYTAGASVIVCLYILVPALHLSSFTGLSGWERLVPFTLLGLAECAIIAIMRKTTRGSRHCQFDSLRTTCHQQASEGMQRRFIQHDVRFPAFPNALPFGS